MSSGTSAQDGRSCQIFKELWWCVAVKYSTWEHGYVSESVPNTILLALHAVVKFLIRRQDEVMLHRERRSQKEFQRDWLACEADVAQHKSLVGELTNCVQICDLKGYHNNSHSCGYSNVCLVTVCPWRAKSGAPKHAHTSALLPLWGVAAHLTSRQAREGCMAPCSQHGHPIHIHLMRGA